MRNVFKFIFLSFIILINISCVNFVSASLGLSTKGINLFNPKEEAVNSTNANNTAVGALSGTLGNIVALIFGFTSLFVFGLVVYGGIVVLTSNGNPEAYKTGLNILQTTLIGLVIVIFSYVIVNFIITNISKIT